MRIKSKYSERMNPQLELRGLSIVRPLGKGSFSTAWVVQPVTPDASPSSSPLTDLAGRRFSPSPDSPTASASSSLSSVAVAAPPLYAIKKVEDAPRARQELRIHQSLAHDNVIKLVSWFCEKPPPSKTAEASAAAAAGGMSEGDAECGASIEELNSSVENLEGSSGGCSTPSLDELELPRLPDVEQRPGGDACLASGLYLVLEYAKGGDLSDRLKWNKQKGTCFSEGVVTKYALQVASGLAYLHAKGVIHRDIKAKNLFLTAGDDVKIGDLGLATRRDSDAGGDAAANGKRKRRMTMCGSPLYTAPEIVCCRRYDNKVDMWSYGVVLFELMCLTLPFQSHSDDKGELFRQICAGKPCVAIPEFYSHRLRMVCTNLLSVDPAHRMSAADVVRVLSVEAVPAPLHASACDEVVVDEAEEATTLAPAPPTPTTPTTPAAEGQTRRTFLCKLRLRMKLGKEKLGTKLNTLSLRKGK